MVGSKAEDAVDCGLVTAGDRRDVGDGIDRKRVLFTKMRGGARATLPQGL